jgi:single-strand DNA-binding protein
VNRKFKKDGEQTADFIPCIAFGKTAEFIEKYFSKGQRIGLTGRIQTGSYDKDGQKVYTTDVIVESVEFVESKNKGDNQEAYQTSRPDPSQAVVDGFMNIPNGIDEELPFN